MSTDSKEKTTVHPEKEDFETEVRKQLKQILETLTNVLWIVEKLLPPPKRR